MLMQIGMYVYTSVNIYVDIHLYTCKQTYEQISRARTHTHSYIHTYIQSYTHTCMHAYVHSFTPPYLHTYIEGEGGRERDFCTQNKHSNECKSYVLADMSASSPYVVVVSWHVCVNRHAWQYGGQRPVGSTFFETTQTLVYGRGPGTCTLRLVRQVAQRRVRKQALAATSSLHPAAIDTPSWCDSCLRAVAVTLANDADTNSSCITCCTTIPN